MFKILIVIEKSWFLILILGGVILGSVCLVLNVVDNLIVNGVFLFDLLFLDWNCVKNNVKIFEVDYIIVCMNYE